MRFSALLLLLSAIGVLSASSAGAQAQAASVGVKAIPGGSTGLKETPLVLDRGFRSPFLLEVTQFARLSGCSPTNGRVLAVRVTDFGEAPDSKLYCIEGVGAVTDIELGRLPDKHSQVGAAAVLRIETTSASGEARTVRLRLTPWAASVEPSERRQ